MWMSWEVDRPSSSFISCEVMGGHAAAKTLVLAEAASRKSQESFHGGSEEERNDTGETIDEISILTSAVLLGKRRGNFTCKLSTDVVVMVGELPLGLFCPSSPVLD